MAIDLYSEQTSPRISFSHDLCQSDITATIAADRIHNETSGFDFSLNNSNSDFEFEFGIFEQELISSADELFADGILLPMQIRKRVSAPRKPNFSKSLPPRPNPSSSEEKILKENAFVAEINLKPEDQRQKQQEAKSFWSFKRSTSLSTNGDQQQQQQGSNRKSFITSIPLLLRRSNSTGSVPNVTKKTSKQITSQKLAKSASAHTPSSNLYTYKMQVKKTNYGGRISPVLNVTPPYISKSTANLFGLGSFFSNAAKDKKKNKRSSFS